MKTFGWGVRGVLLCSAMTWAGCGQSEPRAVTSAAIATDDMGGDTCTADSCTDSTCNPTDQPPTAPDVSSDDPVADGTGTPDMGTAPAPDMSMPSGDMSFQLFAGTTTLPADADPEIHKSAACGPVLGALLGTGGGVAAATCSTACFAALGALPFTAGWSAVVAVPGCVACACALGAVGIGFGTAVSCMVSYVRRYTNQWCANNAPNWANGAADNSEHSCSFTCDNNKCNNFCVNTAAPPPAPAGNWTSGACGTPPAGANDCVCRKPGWSQRFFVR